MPAAQSVGNRLHKGTNNWIRETRRPIFAGVELDERISPLLQIPFFSGFYISLPSPLFFATSRDTSLANLHPFVLSPRV